MKKAKTQKNTWSAVLCRFFFRRAGSPRCARFCTLAKKLTAVVTTNLGHYQPSKAKKRNVYRSRYPATV